MRAVSALLLLVLAGACHDQAGGGAGPRTHIRVVGSSTVYPFTASVAERFVMIGAGVAPVVESTGTGAGFSLFCAGLGPRHPDIADASRRMRAAEYRQCAAHGVTDILEIPIGLDGVVLAEARDGPHLSLTPADVYRALAAEPFGRANRASTWADVAPGLPATPIQVYGPPATSGTRDALADLILQRGCDAADPAARHLPPVDRQARCTRLREDGAFVDAGENDNLVVQKLRTNPQALGAFGFGYLAENAATVRGVPLDGVSPTADTIASGRYPGSRPLFLYVKRAHLDAVPGLRRFVSLYVREAVPGGLLVRRGLIAAPASDRARAAATVARERPLDPASLS